MTAMAEHDPWWPLAAAHALGALESGERIGFEAHLPGCADCRAEVEAMSDVTAAVASSEGQVDPGPAVREQVLDLADAPRLPIELPRYEWMEPAPGVHVHVLEDDRARGVRSVLVWADPGARHPVHRHGGDEVILVLQGGLRDHRGEYHAGEICRSRTGSVHTEEVLPGEICICYVVYYGELEMLESPQP
jgi:putative transcriptional regulator